MLKFKLINKPEHHNFQAEGIVYIHLGVNINPIIAQLEKSFDGTKFWGYTRDFIGTQNIDGQDHEFIHLKVFFKPNRLKQSDFSVLTERFQAALNCFQKEISYAYIEKKTTEHLYFYKDEDEEAERFSYEKKVMFKGKIYDFGYYSQTPGKAVIYQEGEHNMQDSIVVSINDLARA